MRGAFWPNLLTSLPFTILLAAWPHADARALQAARVVRLLRLLPFLHLWSDRTAREQPSNLDELLRLLRRSTFDLQYALSKVRASCLRPACVPLASTCVTSPSPRLASAHLTLPYLASAHICPHMRPQITQSHHTIADRTHRSLLYPRSARSSQRTRCCFTCVLAVTGGL